MGLGRREFLKLVSLALVGTTMDPLESFKIHDDYYINKKLGLLFEKPADWGYISVADFGKLKEKQVLGNDTIDKEELWETLGEPACMITKYWIDTPENKGVFSPTIQVWVNHKSEFDDIPHSSFEEFVELSGEGTSYFLDDFTILEKKPMYMQFGQPFYERISTYSFNHVDLSSPVTVVLNLLAIEHNNFYYFINFHECPEQNQLATEEFDKFKKSIRMV